ncbi:MAG: copper resistance protein B [Woeseiaceae bacterium]|nr:copper resistance protein B [Woeseiaceae bacterium]
MRLLFAAVLLASASGVLAETRYGFVQAERIEFREASDDVLWDVQARYGGDYHRFWFKSEGVMHDGSVDHAEVQALYSRAWLPFFDLQFGLRLSEIDDGDLVSAVAGIQGMAPYRFEIDAALFLSEDGDLSVRAEAERDLLLTRRLVLQPRAKLSLAFDDVPEIGVGSGVSELSIGLRLRYEYTHKFAPYIGVEWHRSFGDTADFIRLAGDDPSETSLTAGVRFWF